MELVLHSYLLPSPGFLSKALLGSLISYSVGMFEGVNVFGSMRGRVVF